MPGEKLKFRPNIPEGFQKEQLEILERARHRVEKGEAQGEIDHNIEYFLIRVPLKSGEKVTECIPKNTGNIAFDKEGQNTASIEEAIEAVQRFYSEMEKPNLREAVKRLREYRASRK